MVPKYNSCICDLYNSCISDLSNYGLALSMANCSLLDLQSRLHCKSSNE